MFEMEKVAIFIDGGYLNRVVKNNFNEIDIDYVKLCDEICSRLNLNRLRTYYYNCLPIIRRMFKTNCSDCNCEFEVHFQPTENKKLLCENCLNKKRIPVKHIIYPPEQTNADQKMRDEKERFYNKLKRLPRFEVKYGELQLIKNFQTPFT